MTEEVPEPASPAATEAPAVDEESANRTFFTGIDAEAGKKKGSKDKNRFRNLESTDSGNKIVQHFQDLTKLANSLDLRMEALLREHEQDFFLAYKTHMYTVQKEIKLLRMKAEQEEAKTREDTKIKALEGELDRFMTQALRLDELCKGYKKEVDKWKAKAEALDEDRRFLEDQIKGAKRQNKTSDEKSSSPEVAPKVSDKKDEGKVAEKVDEKQDEDPDGEDPEDGTRRRFTNSAAMPLVASIKTCVQSLFSMPFKVLGVNILVMLFVPALAKLAGNHDPDANAISHVFGQETICVAMDFPGWREPATVIFFLSGAAGIGRMEIEGRWV
eukprot:symbB.v1.2.018664.t1/scaffold1499.1/size115214/6